MLQYFKTRILPFASAAISRFKRNNSKVSGKRREAQSRDPEGSNSFLNTATATTLHVGQETLENENGVDTQLSYVDPEKLQMRQEVRTTVQPSNVDERNPLTKSEPEVTTQRSDIKQEMFPKSSSDIQPSVHEKQPRKTNEIRNGNSANCPVYKRIWAHEVGALGAGKETKTVIKAKVILESFLDIEN